AMRRADEDDALDSRIGAISHRTDDDTVVRIPGKNVFRSWTEFWIFLPHGLGHRRDLCVSEHSAHAVADNDIRLAIRIKLIGLCQLFAQSERGISNRIPSRIGKYPKLVMFANFRIGLEPVDRFHPGEWRGEKPVHENNGNPLRIVRLKKI